MCSVLVYLDVQSSEWATPSLSLSFICLVNFHFRWNPSCFYHFFSALSRLTLSADTWLLFLFYFVTTPWTSHHAVLLLAKEYLNQFFPNSLWCFTASFRTLYWYFPGITHLSIFYPHSVPAFKATLLTLSLLLASFYMCYLAVTCQWAPFTLLRTW